MVIKPLLQATVTLLVLYSPLAVEAQSVPITAGMDYALARQRLIQAGWKPLVSARPAAKWIPSDSGIPYSVMDEQTSLAQYFRERGWYETLDCAPTGHGRCRQQFFNASGRGLIVTTTNGFGIRGSVVVSFGFGDETR